MHPDLYMILISIPGVFFAVTLHEYSKALTAHALGDTGIRAAGRLTANPFKHMDPLGAIFLVFFGYGWSRPLRLSPFNMRNRKKALATIFIMPFIVNFVFGAAFFVGAHLVLAAFGAPDAQLVITISHIMVRIASYNISFAIFSLIPIYPLSGNLLLAALSPMAGHKLAQRESVLQMALVFFIVLGFAGMVFHPVVSAVLRGLTFTFYL